MDSRDAAMQAATSTTTKPLTPAQKEDVIAFARYNLAEGKLADSAAMAAMTGLLAGNQFNGPFDANTLARQAYRIADAYVAERNRRIFNPKG